MLWVLIDDYRSACAAVRADVVTVGTPMTFDRALTQYRLDRARRLPGITSAGVCRRHRAACIMAG